RPKRMPIAVDWPDVFFKQPEQAFEFDIGGVVTPLCEVDLVLSDASVDGSLTFAVVSETKSVKFRLDLSEQDGGPNYAVKLAENVIAGIKFRGRRIELREFFEEEPPTFWFADGSSLLGNELVTLRRTPEPYAKSKIAAWNWKGTNIRRESQGIDRAIDSIQW